MNIILGKDGKLSVNESPLQGKAADLDNLAAFISNPSDGDAIVYDASAGIWKAGASGGGGLPSVTAVDNGKVLTVESGAWAAATPSGGGALIVNIDTSNMTLDKTWAEINTAYTAGKQVLVAYSLGPVSGVGSVVGVESSSVQYTVYVYFDGFAALTTDTETGYPVLGDN